MAKKKQNKKLTDDYLKSHAQDRFILSKNWIDQRVKQDWLEGTDLYNSVFSTKEKKQSDVLLGQGRLFIPKTYAHVQRILVDVLDEFFSDPDEIVEVIGGKDSIKETSDIVKALLNYRLNGRPIDFYAEAYEACLDAIRNKVGIFKIYPDLVTAKISKPNPLTGETVDQEVITEFNPIIDCLPYEDVFFDVMATWKDYHKHTIIHRMIKSKDYLRRRGYKNLDRVNPAANTMFSYDEVKYQRTEDQGQPGPLSSGNVDDIDNIIVYDVWTYLDVDGDGLLESCNYLMAGDFGGMHTVISDVKKNLLPYFDNRPPFVVGSAFPESHKMYGKDLPNIIKGLQKETNALRNQRREAVALSLRKPLLVNKNSAIDMTALQNRKIGAIVMGDDISEQSVRELQMTDATVGSAQEQARTDQDFYETTSISPNLMGMPTNSQETATATQSHVANASKKIHQIIRNLTYTLFLPTFKMILQLEQEYETDEFISKITGQSLGWKFREDGVPAIEYIKGEFTLRVNQGRSKQSQLQSILMLMDRANMANTATAQMVQAQIIPPGTATFIDVMKLFKRALPILGEKNVNEYDIQSQPPPRQMEEMPPGVASQSAPSQIPNLSNNQHGIVPAMPMNNGGMP